MRAGGVKAQAPRSPLPSSRDPGAVSARPGAVGRGPVPGVVWRYASSNARGDCVASRQGAGRAERDARRCREGAGFSPRKRRSPGPRPVSTPARWQLRRPPWRRRGGRSRLETRTKERKSWASLRVIKTRGRNESEHTPEASPRGGTARWTHPALRDWIGVRAHGMRPERWRTMPV